MENHLAAIAGGDGILRVQLNEAVTNEVPDMTVTIGTFRGFLSGEAVEMLSQFLTTAIVAPSSGNDRIDLVQYTLGVSINIKTGVEHATTPVAPTKDANSLSISKLYLRDTATSIKEVDDATNGYIIEARQWL